MAQYYESGHRSFQVDAAYARGLRMKLSSSTANLITVAGVADAEIGTLTAASFANLDPADVLLNSSQGTREYVANGAITVNAKVYRAALGKVSATAAGASIGVALTSTSADGDFVEVLRGATTGSATEKLYTNVAASTAVANTTTETLFDKNFSIPAGYLSAGDRLRIRYQGIATATNSTDTLVVKLYVGGLTGTALLASTATDVANNNIFTGEFDLVVRTAGASGTMAGVGSQAIVPAATNVAVPVFGILASTAIDTTAAQVVGVGATWSVANAGDSCRLDILDIDISRA
jgi:hypothetical protein